MKKKKKKKKKKEEEEEEDNYEPLNIYHNIYKYYEINNSYL